MEDFTQQFTAFKSDIMAAVTEMKSRADQMAKQLSEKGVADPELKESLARVIKRTDEIDALIKRPDGGGASPVIAKSIAQAVWESAGLKKYQERGWHQGGFVLSFKSLFEPLLETKTTIDSAAVGSSTPGILVPQRVGDIIKPGVRTLRVRDLLPRFQTTNNAIEFVKENVFTSAASPVVEANAKAESALTFTIDSAPVRTIAHWIPASNQVLADWGQLQGFIETRLIEGLKDKEDSELLTGDGLGVHISGLITEATAYDTALNVGSDTRIDKLRHALRQLRASEFEPDGIVLHPNDWEVIELIKTEEGGANKGVYIMGGPANTSAPRIWGKPVALTTAMTSGKFLVGDFARACAVYDRMEARIDISTEHSDYFTKNLVAIRAEERLALAVYQPTRLIYGTF